jgi:hypothetical protein
MQMQKEWVEVHGAVWMSSEILDSANSQNTHAWLNI